MLDPIKEFEDERIKFNSVLNYKYTWKNRSENVDERTKQYEEYKDKIGAYVELYNKPRSEEDLYVNIYPTYEKISKKLSLLKNTQEKIKSSLEHKYDKDGNNFVFKKGNYIYKGTKYFYTPEQEKQFFKDTKIGYYGDK